MTRYSWALEGRSVVHEDGRPAVAAYAEWERGHEPVLSVVCGKRTERWLLKNVCILEG